MKSFSSAREWKAETFPFLGKKCSNIEHKADAVSAVSLAPLLFEQTKIFIRFN